MNKVKLQKMVNNQINKFNIIFLVIVLIFLGMSYAGLMFHWILVLFPIGFIAVIFPVLTNMYYEYTDLKLIRNKLQYDPVRAKELIDAEVEDLSNLLSNKKTEMDIHAFNATNEDKAYRNARRNESSFKRRYSRYLKMQQVAQQIIDDLTIDQNDPFKL